MKSTKIKLANQLEKEKIIRRLTYKYQGKLLYVKDKGKGQSVIVFE